MQDLLTDVERALLQINGRLDRRLFVIAGPSGVGKNTIIRELLARHPRVMDRVRTYTTRPRRDHEVDGVQYYFVGREQFMELARANRLMEADADNPLGHDVYDTDHSYSMPHDIYEDVSPEAHIVIAEVDVVGAERLKTRFPSCVRIFVTAPPHDLLERIRSRPDPGMDNDKLEHRMETARKMIAAAKHFDYVVYNREGLLTDTVLHIESIIRAERMRVREGFDLEAILPADAFDMGAMHDNGHE